MPYANAHILLRVIGHFGTSGSPVDNWSAGLRFAIVGADVPTSSANLQTFVDSCATAFKTFHAATGVNASTDCFLAEVDGARVGPDGKYLPASQLTARNTFTPVAGTSSLTQPWNTALVFSLRTSNPRGYASNGRFYYPMCAAGLSAGTGRVSTGGVTPRLTAFKTCLEACNTAAAVYATNMKCCVLSKVGGGLTAVVNGVRSDGRLDSIERRENKLASTWSSVTIT